MTAPSPQTPYKQLLLDLAHLSEAISVYVTDVLATVTNPEAEPVSAATESNLGAALVEVGFDLIARAVSRVEPPTPDQQP